MGLLMVGRDEVVSFNSFNSLAISFGSPSREFFCFTKSSRRLKPLFVSLQHQPVQKPVTAKISTQQDSFTVNYLINSCGFSLEDAISTSQRFRIQSSEKPDSVRSLFREFGFSETQISNVVRKRPCLLSAHPVNTLLPKLQFFRSIGLSSTELARIFSRDPSLLTRSLENQIIPAYSFLKSIMLSDEKVVCALRRTTWIFHEDYSKKVIPNVELLRELGVPVPCIALLLCHFPEAAIQRHEEFSAVVKEVKEMGFDPKKSIFVLAVHCISGKANKAIWKRCFEIYRRWGWSEDDILTAFKKHPHSMMLSEKKLEAGMDYFVNKMGWPSKAIVQCPGVLFFNLDKRIKPRCKVIQVVLSKGLIKEPVSLASVVIPAEKLFFQRFIIKFEEEVPQLLNVYKGKLAPEEV